MRLIFAFIILLLTAACQQTLVIVEPSATQTPQPLVLFTPRPTQTPRTVVIPMTATLAPTQPLPTPTLFPTLPPVTRVTPAEREAAPTENGTPGTPTATPVQTLMPQGNVFLVGQSTEGRDIWGWRFGAGSKVLLLVGGVHTGFEANTVVLMNEMVAHFQSTPADILPGMTVIIIPVMNPDGLVLGRRAQGRFNRNNVDLNRNWGCEWSAEAYWQQRQVDPGPRAFSEPETVAMAQLIRDYKPASAIFYHSAAAGIFAGNCEGGHGSDGLAAVLGEATGYAYGSPFSAYPVTGTAASWVDGQGIPAVDLELSGTRETEFIRNLRGVMAVQRWLTGSG